MIIDLILRETVFNLKVNPIKAIALIDPLLVIEGKNHQEEIPSMPEIYR